MMPTLLPALIHRECVELDRLVETCLNRFARRAEFVKSGSEDILADSLAACLHSFYGGLERIFEAIVREIDGTRGRSAEWHRELLQAVSVERAGSRPAVISEASYRELEEYRAFRHLFRHLYTHHIDPARIFRIMEGLERVWSCAREDLMRFKAILESAP
jgi:hypothetical protein